MDPVSLALAAANALIAAMATDAWEESRNAVVALWRKVHPNRAVAISDELADVRDEAVAIRGNYDVDAEEDLISDWRRRFQRLLAADPGVAEELQRVVLEVLMPAIPATDQKRVNQLVMNARASGEARIYQAGRDMQVNGHD